jgi:CHAD domain-containing protein
LRAELGWLAAILGDVRDGDVMLERLRRRAEALPAQLGEPADQVLGACERERAEARALLQEALASERYAALLDRLVAAANEPALDEASAAPALEVVPDLVRRPWHKLEKRVERLGASPSDDQLHDLRIRTKRVRYAADAVAPVVGKAARGLARAAAGLQEVLGELNDAVVAASWLRQRREATSDQAEIRATEALAAYEHDAAAGAREGWRAAWEKLAAPEMRSWM